MRRSALGFVVMVALAAGCTDTAATGDADPVVTGSGPGVEVSVAPGPHSTLSAVVTIRTDAPSRPRVVARSGGHDVEVAAALEPATEHVIPLVGLRPERAYRVLVRGGDELAEAPEVTFRSGALPADLPEVEAEVFTGARPGFTLFNASTDRPNLFRQGYLLAVDRSGEVVWYHRTPQSIADARQLDDGSIIFNYGSTGARRIDVLGNVLDEWTTTVRVDAGRFDQRRRPTYGEDAVVLDTLRLHHEVADQLDNGNYLAMGMEIIEVEGFGDQECPDDPLPPGPRRLRVDTVLEFTAAGDIVRELSMADVIDPLANPGVGQCEVRTDAMVAGEESFIDWTHGNAAEVFADENLLVVSLRNLNGVFGIRWEDDAEGEAGELLWHLGPDGDFELTEGEWFYGQHAPERQGDGSWLIYDNGTARPGTTVAEAGSAGRRAPFSRAVVYDLDVEAGTATETFESRLTEANGTPTFADFLGDADAIGERHLLVNHGAITDPETGTLGARIVETERVTGEIVADIRVPGTADHGWRVYRAEHLDELLVR